LLAHVNSPTLLELPLKLRSLVFTSLVILLNSNSALSAKFVQLNEQQLAQVKLSIQNKSASQATINAYDRLIVQADALLDIEEFSVTHKEIETPTKDPHDYLSISRYWWPDESQKDGLPWIRRDGETNPDTQTDKVDRKRIGGMTQAVKHLSYAYYFSGNKVYAKKGVALIKAWFLNDTTHMNPNLNFAQSVPGIDKQRRSGILDGRLIPLWVLDSIALFSTSDYWNEADNKKMNAWLSEYLTWLTTSKMGKSGARQTNNHGSWYRFQVTALAWYLEDTKMLAKELEKANVAMAKQFNEQGAQEHELKRTKSFFYSCFNLNAITRTAIIAEKAGGSMWNYPSQDNSELVNAIEFLLPFARGEEWPYPSKGVNLTDLVSVMVRYYKQTGKQEHRELLDELIHLVKNKAENKNRERLLLDNLALFEPALIN